MLAVSVLRETDPVGVGEQPPFLNGAVALETTLAARELLEVLLVRRAPFRPRPQSPASTARGRSISTFSSTATSRSTSPV